MKRIRPRVSSSSSSSSSSRCFRNTAIPTWWILLALFCCCCNWSSNNNSGNGSNTQSCPNVSSMMSTYNNYYPPGFAYALEEEEYHHNDRDTTTNSVSAGGEEEENDNDDSHPQQEQSGGTVQRRTTYLKERKNRKSINEPQQQELLSNSGTRSSSSNNGSAHLPLNQILRKAIDKGLGGGIPGAVAGMIQVLTLMWMRTIVNYQCRYGTTFYQALVTLNNEGGVPRFYRGMTFALVQAPLSRFVSTFSNDGVNSLMASLTDWGPARTTAVASIVVGLWRIVLMPVDTCKTVLQVDSIEGFRNLMRRVRAGKIAVLYQGAIATSVAAVIGHYPWFFTYNLLSTSSIIEKLLPFQLLRNAGIGLASSVVADTVVNAIRVVKTTKQSIGSKHSVTYTETIRMILAADGWKGLFGRGLKTRIMSNALQSILFTVIWRGIAERHAGGRNNTNNTTTTTTTKEEKNPTAR